MYSQTDLDILLKQENDLRYDSFTCEDAFQLGIETIECAKHYDRGIVVRITRELDNLVLFQSVMEEKAERNFTFAEMKHTSVLKHHHSSAYVYVISQMEEGYEPTSAGAFPIFLKDGTHVATIMVSGLHEGKDHTVIIEALQNKLHISTAQFTNKLL